MKARLSRDREYIDSMWWENTCVGYLGDATIYVHCWHHEFSRLGHLVEPVDSKDALFGDSSQTGEDRRVAGLHSRGQITTIIQYLQQKEKSKHHLGYLHHHGYFFSNPPWQGIAVSVNTDEV